MDKILKDIKPGCSLAAGRIFRTATLSEWQTAVIASLPFFAESCHSPLNIVNCQNRIETCHAL